MAPVTFNMAAADHDGWKGPRGHLLRHARPGQHLQPFGRSQAPAPAGRRPALAVRQIKVRPAATAATVAQSARAANSWALRVGLGVSGEGVEGVRISPPCTFQRHQGTISLRHVPGPVLNG